MFQSRRDDPQQFRHLDRARALALGLNQASDAIQVERQNADRDIAAAVEVLNTTLRQVRELNSQIRSFSGAGNDTSALLDQRQQLVDRIAEIVPVRELPRDHNQVALITTGGAVLLDGNEAEFGFTPVSTIVPELTLASGGLSGLTINGRPMATAGTASLIQGGSLAALFAVRDELAIDGQARLDAMALDLYQRFADAGVENAPDHLWTQQICAKSASLSLTPCDQFPDFPMPMKNLDTISLHSLLADKLTLIDLWASWCAPCRQENRNILVPHYGINIIIMDFK